MSCDLKCSLGSMDWASPFLVHIKYPVLIMKTCFPTWIQCNPVAPGSLGFAAVHFHHRPQLVRILNTSLCVSVGRSSLCLFSVVICLLDDILVSDTFLWTWQSHRQREKAEIGDNFFSRIPNSAFSFYPVKHFRMINNEIFVKITLNLL